MRSTERFDLVAIGGGPAGRAAAVQAARLGKRAAIIDRVESGGSGPSLGCASSKVLRAASLELTGQAMGVYGKGFQAKHGLDIDDLVWKAPRMLAHEHEAELAVLRRSGVRVIEGDAAFRDPHTLEVRTAGPVQEVRAEYVVIAVGTVPDRPRAVDFDDSTVLDSDAILVLRRLPRTMTVVGGSVIGLEYASLAACMGIDVAVVEKGPRLLSIVDEDIADALQYHLRGLGVVFRLGDPAVAVRRLPSGSVMTRLASGGQLASESAVFAASRRGATAGLELAAAGLEPDRNGRIAVDAELRTAQPNVFAAGAVLTRTALTTTGAHQGRAAVLAAYGRDHAPETLVAHGIHTIPEIACVGMTERQLADQAIPHVVGKAHYRDVSRADLAGDRAGLLKLLVCSETHRLLGVHAFGTSATELIHVGQTLIAAGLPVEYLLDGLFHAPTFTNAYTLAAQDAAGRLWE
jgi:NAD(P) transhydrogenase